MMLSYLSRVCSTHDYCTLGISPLKSGTGQQVSCVADSKMFKTMLFIIIIIIIIIIILARVFAARRSYSFESGICHRIRVGRAGGRTEALLESAK